MIYLNGINEKQFMLATSIKITDYFFYSSLKINNYDFFIFNYFKHF